MKVNPIQFNIIIGLTTLIGFLFSGPSILLGLPLWVLVLLSLILYFSEFWAFLFKLKFARVKYLYELSGGIATKKVGETSDPGCMMFYAFLMRMIFRIVLGMVVIMGLRGTLEKDMNGVQIGFMIAIVMFELFNMLYSMYDSHIFSSSTDDEREEEKEAYWVKEIEWRKKMFPKVNKTKENNKELLANLILILMAIAVTKLFWDGINSGFVDFIIRTEKFNESVSFAVIFVLISCFVLCLFFLMPVRLAFWIEEKINANSPKEKLNYKLSLLFAGVAICSPTIFQMIRTFLF